MPHARLLWATGKQTFQHIDDITADWLSVERDGTMHMFRATDDDDNLPVYKEEPPAATSAVIQK
jgi:hypothetical protein